MLPLVVEGLELAVGVGPVVIGLIDDVYEACILDELDDKDAQDPYIYSRA
jgi:hypothetical protein